MTANESAARGMDVCVVGELNPDLILYGLPENPKPDHEYLIDGFRLTLGSSSAIFAHNLAVLGTRVGMVSKVGADTWGNMALDWLASADVDLSCVVTSSGKRGTGLSVILAHPAHRFILTYPGTIFDLSYEDLNLDYVFSAQHLHLSSYYLNRALRPRMAELFREAKNRGLTTSLDTNDDPEGKWAADLFDVLPFVDIFFPNEREAIHIARTDDVRQALDALAKLCGTVVVKLGSRGAVARQGQKEWSCPIISVTPQDTVGAGDSFDAGYIYRFLEGASPEECLQWANATGAYSTTRQGGTEAFRNRAEMDLFFETHLPAR